MRRIVKGTFPVNLGRHQDATATDVGKEFPNPPGGNSEKIAGTGDFDNRVRQDGLAITDELCRKSLTPAKFS